MLAFCAYHISRLTRRRARRRLFLHVEISPPPRPLTQTESSTPYIHSKHTRPVWYRLLACLFHLSLPPAAPFDHYGMSLRRAHPLTITRLPLLLPIVFTLSQQPLHLPTVSQLEQVLLSIRRISSRAYVVCRAVTRRLASANFIRKRMKGANDGNAHCGSEVSLLQRRAF